MTVGSKVVPILLMALGALAIYLILRDGAPPEEVRVQPSSDTIAAENPTRTTAPSTREVAVTEIVAPLEGTTPPSKRLTGEVRGEGEFDLHGEVLDSVTEKPVEMYRMWCEPVHTNLTAAASQAFRGRTWSNPLGTFTYHGLEEGEYNLLIKVQGYQQLIVPSVAVPTEESRLTFLLQRGAYIDVTVQDGDGDGVSDLEVRITPVLPDDPTKLPRIRLRFTDNHGKATFTDLPTGVYKVEMGNAALSEFASQEFYVSENQEYPVLFIIPTLNSIRVSARDTEGHALNLVQVRMWSTDGLGVFRAETDRKGGAVIRHVPAGEYTLKLYKHGFRREDSKIQVQNVGGEIPLELVLTQDAAAAWAEENPTPEQLERLKAGERPADVFGKKDGH